MRNNKHAADSLLNTPEHSICVSFFVLMCTFRFTICKQTSKTDGKSGNDLYSSQKRNLITDQNIKEKAEMLNVDFPISSRNNKHYVQDYIACIMRFYCIDSRDYGHLIFIRVFVALPFSENSQMRVTQTAQKKVYFHAKLGSAKLHTAQYCLCQYFIVQSN